MEMLLIIKFIFYYQTTFNLILISLYTLYYQITFIFNLLMQMLNSFINFISNIQIRK
jgi:hypothetical protein